MTGWILLAAVYAIGMAGYAVRDMVEGEGYWAPRWRYLAWPVGVLNYAYEQRAHARVIFDAWWLCRVARIKTERGDARAAQYVNSLTDGWLQTPFKGGHNDGPSQIKERPAPPAPMPPAAMTRAVHANGSVETATTYGSLGARRVR